MIAVDVLCQRAWTSGPLEGHNCTEHSSVHTSRKVSFKDFLLQAHGRRLFEKSTSASDGHLASKNGTNQILRKLARAFDLIT